MFYRHTHQTWAQPQRHRTARQRLWGVCLALSLLAAACASSSDDATVTATQPSEPTSTTAVEIETDGDTEADGDPETDSDTEVTAEADGDPETDSDTEVTAEADGDPETDSDTEVTAEADGDAEADADGSTATTASAVSASASTVAFEVTIDGEVVFDEDRVGGNGTFAVTSGAEALGCEGGTATEKSDAPPVVEKLWTCASGSRSGAISIEFVPPAGTWTVTGASGDFAGLGGSGDWSGMVVDDGARGVDSLTGTMSYGNETPSVESLTDVPVTPPQPATNDLVADAIAIDPATLPFISTVDTTTATSDDDDENVGCPAPQSDATVWYTFTSPVDTRITVSPAGSDFPAGISAVAGEPGLFELIECRPIAFEVAIQADTTYYFQVFDGEDPDSQGGTLVFQVDTVERPPLEDLEPFGQDFVEAVAAETPTTYGAFAFAVVDAVGNTTIGTSGGDTDGNAPTADDVFRVGSITKVLTSVAVLSLVEDGVVDLDAAASDYINRVAVPDGVTVRDLLQHTSGIFNYTDSDSFFADVFADPDRTWIPEDVVEIVSDEPTLFEPGSEFNYSNTNFILLGLLIEEVTGEAYDQVVRKRILDPLDMSSTYLAGFENGPPVFHPYEHLGTGVMDYTAVATSAWAAGAMVSSAGDLHLLFTALFNDEIVQSDLVDEMIDGEEYGLGLDLTEADQGLYGHGGGIPGYRTFVLHSPELGITAFTASTDDTVNTDFANEKMFEAFDTLGSQ